MPVKTKFYKICQSGPTIDGREISPELINQMAESYSPATYGARVNCEHLLSLMPRDTPFPAFGDVLALKAEDGPDGTRVLLAQIEATDALIALNKKRQKVYWSAEITQNFAKSGKAYLTGLAITDTPACLGTEMIKLTAGLFAADGKMISGGLESALEFEDEPAAPEPSGADTLLSEIAKLFQRAPKTEPEPPPVPDPAGADRFAKIEEGMGLVAKSVAEISATVDKLSKDAAAPRFVTLDAFQDLLNRLSAEPAGAAPPAPHAGDGGGAKTDC